MNINILRLDDANGENSSSLRLHHSEPSLCYPSYNPIPRLNRLHSQQPQSHDAVVDDSDSADASQSSVLVAATNNKPLPVKRKISLGSLLTKPSIFKPKWTRSRELLSSRSSKTKSQNSLLAVPRSSLDASGQGASIGPPIRVRSRSTPFNEMSPINESTLEVHKETILSESVDALVPLIALTDFSTSVDQLVPECSVVHISHSFQASLKNAASSYSSVSEELEEETLAVVFNVGSSEDGSLSSMSSDSESSPARVTAQSHREAAASRLFNSSRAVISETMLVLTSQVSGGADDGRGSCLIDVTRDPGHLSPCSPQPLEAGSGTTNLHLNAKSTDPPPTPDDKPVSSLCLPIRSPRCVVAFNTSLEPGKQATAQLRANSPAPAATTVTVTTTASTPTSTTAPVSATAATPSKPALCQRRSSDSEISVTPKGLTRHL